MDSELCAHLKGGESAKSSMSRIFEHEDETPGWCTYSIYPVANAYVSTKDVQEDIKSALRRIPGAIVVPGSQREEVLVPLGLPSQCLDDPAFAEETCKRVEAALEVADRLFRAGTDVTSLSSLESERTQAREQKQRSQHSCGSDVQLAAVRALAQIAGVVLPQAQSHSKSGDHQDSGGDSKGAEFTADQCRPDNVRTAFEAAAARP